MSTSTSETTDSHSVTELVSGIVADVQKLGMQHLALFRYEVKEDLRHAGGAAASLATGLAVVQVGGLLICLMLVHGLAVWAPTLPLWGCFGIIGAAVLIIGFAAIARGAMKLKKIESLSQQAADIIKDDTEWLTQPK